MVETAILLNIPRRKSHDAPLPLWRRQKGEAWKKRYVPSVGKSEERKMERLTKREFGEITCSGREIPCSSFCNNCSQGTGNCEIVKRMVEKLANYEDLEEQRRLLKLPCKVGDTVYEVIENGDIVKYKITGISINDTNMCFIYGEGRYKEGEGEKYYGKFLPSEFGKTIFTTLSEDTTKAEAKLKELRGNND